MKLLKQHCNTTGMPSRDAIPDGEERRDWICKWFHWINDLTYEYGRYCEDLRERNNLYMSSGSNSVMEAFNKNETKQQVRKELDDLLSSLTKSNSERVTQDDLPRNHTSEEYNENLLAVGEGKVRLLEILEKIAAKYSLLFTVYRSEKRRLQRLSFALVLDKHGIHDSSFAAHLANQVGLK